uniref:Ovule protein n=1 Tax=Panagrellus redivivus TaxID=6233 RepID=A0A7E4WCA7_PANRE
MKPHTCCNNLTSDRLDSVTVIVVNVVNVNCCQTMSEVVSRSNPVRSQSLGVNTKQNRTSPVFYCSMI